MQMSWHLNTKINRTNRLKLEIHQNVIGSVKVAVKYGNITAINSSNKSTNQKKMCKKKFPSRPVERWKLEENTHTHTHTQADKVGATSSSFLVRVWPLGVCVYVALVSAIDFDRLALINIWREISISLEVHLRVRVHLNDLTVERM